MIALFVIFLTAHCLGEFLLHLRSTGTFAVIINSLIKALLVALLMLLQSEALFIVPIVFLVYFLEGNRSKPFWESSRGFALSQFIKISVLFLIAFMASKYFAVEVIGHFALRGTLFVFAGFCAAVFGAGEFLNRFMGEIAEKNALALPSGLKDGEKLIGSLERSLVFLLILLQQPMVIGLLLVAKAILRYSEARDPARTEYVLIGTLFSFALAIAITAATLALAGGQLLSLLNWS